MTPRSSVRAAARAIYREMAKAKATEILPNTPLPDPPPQGGREKKDEGGGEQDDLTARVRALYEDSAVPVREIAALVGVTERTIYKYVIKQNWKRRYACVARGDDAVARANRGRCWQRAPGHEPVKGAGGRFIRREDKDKPFARGLKATDPSGRARALESCGQAAQVARAAQSQAQAEALARQRHAALLRAIDATTRAFADLRRFREESGPGKPRPPRDRLEHLFVRCAEIAVARLRIVVAAQEAATSTL